MVVVLDGGAEVEADLADGYSMASWQQDEAGSAIRAYDEDGDLLIETDAGP